MDEVEDWKESSLHVFGRMGPWEHHREEGVSSRGQLVTRGEGRYLLFLVPFLQKPTLLVFSKMFQKENVGKGTFF